MKTTKMGRPLKFAEKTKIYSVRLPESKYEALKAALDQVVLNLIRTS